ncbi:MAG: hypothetical protein J5992_08060 [Oscillospiraceae bacterium]|nr:hypothetical protein [Oscillospiraceae bacterium]
MARETNCPICQKLLIGGQCPDCGYYVDTHQLASDINDLDVNAGHLCESHNGGSNYNTYEADAGHLCESHNGEPSVKVFSAKERDINDMSKSDQQLKKERDYFILSVILTVTLGLWGYLISHILLASVKANPKYKKKLTTVFVVMIVITVIFYVGSILLSFMTA